MFQLADLSYESGVEITTVARHAACGIMGRNCEGFALAAQLVRSTVPELPQLRAKSVI
jgi:hypothetical protein